MARKRLNDTAAVATMPLSDNHYCSVSVRKIDNGFVTSKSKDGQYSETYSATKPDLDGNSYGNSPDAGNSMTKAKAYLNQQ